MGAEHIIGLRLVADNKEAVPAIKAVRDEQDRLGVSARALSSEADRLNTAQSRMSDSYRQISIAAQAANMSVAQYTNAMRQLPMQFTDIVTGLISGQSPLTVLVQQGGQLKDTFGGVGNAATAMGTYIMGLVNPVSVVAAAVTSGAAAWYYWGRESESAAEKAVNSAQKVIDSMKSTDAVYVLQREKQKLSGKIAGAWLLYDDKELQKLSSDSQLLIAEYKKIDKQLEEEKKRSLSSWETLYATPAEQRDMALRKLNQNYAEQRTITGKNEAELLALQEQFNTKKLTIEDNYQKSVAVAEKAKNKDAVAANEKAKKLAEQHARELADSQAKAAILDMESQSGIKLTEAQKRIVLLSKEQEQPALRMTASEYARKVQNQAVVANAEINAQARSKELSDSAKMAEHYAREAEALKKKNDATALKNEMMGKTAAEQAALQVAAIDAEIAALSEAKAALDISAAYDTQRVALQKLIDEKNREKGLVSDAANKKNANTASAQDTASTNSSIRTGVSATTNAFFADNGRSFTENFTGSFKSALEPSINKLVTQLIVNAVTTEAAMTSNISTSDWVMAIIAAVSTQFGNQARSMGTTTNVRGTLDGATSGNQSKAMQMDQTWFEAQKNWNIITQASRATLNAYSADIRSSAEAMYAAGDVLGVAGMRARSLSINVSTAGNVTDALARNIGVQLVPAIVLFQREGENLAATAKRLTDEFTATNNLINAVGVSSGKAFGGFGLQSVAAREDLIAAAGGLQAFSSASKSYIQNFLTPAQQLQPALDDVAKTFNKLGITGVSTNAEFAALVKAQMELGNTSVVGQLMTVADSFNTITKSAGDANNQLNALLNKDNFTSLVDYKRAMALNGAGSIASAQLSAAQKAAQDQAGTAAFTSANAGAIAAANQASSTVSTTPTTTGYGSVLNAILDILKLIAHWGSIIAGVIDSIAAFVKPVWTGIWDGVTGIWDAAKGFVNGIINGFKDALSSLGGLLGGGGSGGFPNPISAIGDLFSDPRLKENVRQVGTTSHGLGQYDFSYIGDPTHTRYRGVMSDEVRRVMPSAVSVGRDGFDRVNYAKLGIQMYKIPSFAVGTNYLPEDMLVQAHKAERIIPAADNRELMERLRNPAAANDAMVVELRALREEVAKLRLAADKAQTAADKTQVNTEGTHAVLKQFRDTGLYVKAAA